MNNLMMPASALPMTAPIVPTSTFYCEHCSNTARFLNPTRASRVAAVSRSTIYYWMDRGWVHWRLLPSGRRVICAASLSRSVEVLPRERES